jgi:hypothetical protein
MLVLPTHAPYESNPVRGNIHELVELNRPKAPRSAKPPRAA